MPVGQRAPGRLQHLERARDAGAVARLQRSADRIAPRQFGMQRLDALALQPRAHAARISAGIGGTADSPRVSALK